MLTVHKMPLKNLFLTGISSVYDKTLNQNELQTFTSLNFEGNCMFDFLGKKSCRRVTETFNRDETIHYSSTNPFVGLLLTLTFLITYYCNFALFLDKSN